MLSLSISSCVTIVLMVCAITNAQQTQPVTVSLRIESNEVGLGDTVTLECEIRNPPQTSIVSFLRQTALNNERLTWGGNLVEAAGTERLALREYPSVSPTSRIIALTIYKLAVEDEGEYVCEVYDGETYESVGEDRARLLVQGDSGQPQVPAAVPTCTSNPDLSQPIYEGTSVDFLCQITDSKANIEWTDAFGKIPGQVTYNENGVITSRLIRTVTAQDDAALFICSVKDQEKEGEKCYVGPLIVAPDPGRPGPEPPVYYTKKPDHGEYTEKVQIGDNSGKTKRVIEKCMAFCSALVDLE